eukprot:869419-Prymnesium_polylepis.1
MTDGAMAPYLRRRTAQRKYSSAARAQRLVLEIDRRLVVHVTGARGRGIRGRCLDTAWTAV